MKNLAVLTLLVVGASANVLRFEEKFIPITSLDNEIRGSLLNNHKYSTGHGITVTDNTEAVRGRGALYLAEAGQMVQSDVGLIKSGSFSFTTPEGLPISLTYVADENGFRAEGAHLPRSVELPAEHAEAHREALARVATVVRAYEEPTLVVKSSYDAPAIRVESSYDAPVIRVNSY